MYTNEECLKNITSPPEITDKITAVMNAILTAILWAELTQIFCVTVTSVYNPAEGTETLFPYKSFRAVPQCSVHFSFNVIREMNCRKYLNSYLNYHFLHVLCFRKNGTNNRGDASILNPQGLHFETTGLEEWEDKRTGLAAEESIMVSGMCWGYYARKPTQLNGKNWFKYLFV